MKRKIYSLLVITTALLMWSYNAFAERKADAPVENNTPAMNGEAPDEKNVIDNTTVFVDVQNVFSEFCSANDLAKNMKKITSIKYVANADFNESTGKMTVTLVNNEKKTFYNPLLDENARMSENVKVYKANESKRIGKTVWIGNGLHDDEKFINRTEMLERLAKRLCDIGFDVTYTSTWNDELLFSSDIVLYHGHGGKYKDEKNEGHFINTGIPKRNDLKSLPLGMFISASNNYSINEEYINSKSNYYMKPNSLVYLACCDLLDNNDKMAQVFLKKGAAAVVGYKGEANFSSIGGAVFLDQLSTGNTISEAFDYLKNEVDDSFFTTVIDYASQLKYLDYLKSEMDSYRNKPKDIRIITYSKEESKNIDYVDPEGREELIRLYKLLKGDKWDDAHKENWCSGQSITTWAGVSYDKKTYGIDVQLLKKNTLNDKTKFPLPADLKLEDFKRIRSIRLPEGNEVGNLTVKNCTILKSITELHAGSLVISGCPQLESVDMRGARDVQISDCDNIKMLATDYAPEVKALKVSNCKSLSTFQCFGYVGGLFDNLFDELREDGPDPTHKKSQLKSLEIEECDNLENITLQGCPLSGTLDISQFPNLKSLSISYTDIREVKFGYNELESLSITDTPIVQNYESIPGWEKHQYQYVLEKMYTYERWEKGINPSEGFKWAGEHGEDVIYYDYNYEDRHGFYHGLPKEELVKDENNKDTSEPYNPAYWPEW